MNLKNNNQYFLMTFYLMLMNFMIIMFMSNIFMKWMIMELSSMIMMFMLNFNYPNKSVSIYFFMVSSLTSMMLIFMIILKMNLLLTDSMSFFFWILMFMKLGIYPFSTWMVFCYEYMSWLQIFLMSTFMKFLPIIIISELNISQSIIIMLILSNILISIKSLNYWSMKKIIACSSINHNFSLILLIFINKPLFMLYSMLYTLIILNLLMILNYNNINNKNDLLKLSPIDKFIYNLSTILFMMLPPMSTYMLKWMFNFEIMLKFKFLWIILFLETLSTLIMLWNYLNFMNNSMSNTLKLPLTFKCKINYSIYLKSLIFIILNLMMMSFFEFY